jgi:hypothetical protein
VVRPDHGLFGVEGMHILGVSTQEDGTLMLDVETGQTLAGCASCRVVVVCHDRRAVRHDTPCFGRPRAMLRAAEGQPRSSDTALPVIDFVTVS